MNVDFKVINVVYSKIHTKLMSRTVRPCCVHGFFVFIRNVKKKHNFRHFRYTVNLYVQIIWLKTADFLRRPNRVTPVIICEFFPTNLVSTSIRTFSRQLDKIPSVLWWYSVSESAFLLSKGYLILYQNFTNIISFSFKNLKRFL